ncbi:MAG: multidrug ABC transporter ATP-binding protein [Epulopiscium sp. Nele67-Bin002]|nr:MAG: multidrug ABC transporter ATP-binding protein [Epulopiscium sp. Nuni2H_MBin001]OON91341.1 MAG: multidrug ABC transporter ATP-binding protein [Epulopiscium sp. Nele67-Bin002]OON94121.1 MAG: multidrug ABC transporter ATP-binding protein [Epulopiscium sp. Nele67-Bin001]
MAAVIEIKNMYKSFKGRNLYNDINLEIQHGECVGFVGHNGVGKSVLFQLMVGLLPVDKGQVKVFGEPVGGKEGKFPSNVGIFINSPGYIDFYSGFKNLKLLAEINSTINDSAIKNIMELVGLDPTSKVPVKKYSSGMKQKLGIAQAIMEDQQLIILDEPYNALDFQTNKDITNVLSQLVSQGKTLLLTSHQHEYLEKLCNKVYFVNNATIVPLDDTIKQQYFSI